MLAKPDHSIHSVAEVQLLQGAGPWPTKSGGELNVLFALPFTDLTTTFLTYPESELQMLSKDMRGLRSYKVSGLHAGILGANEWHKIRQELVFVLRGSIQWICEDLYGDTRKFELRPGRGVWVPSYMLHTYVPKEDNSEILVIANTLFEADDTSTQDTYSIEAFRELQQAYK